MDKQINVTHVIFDVDGLLLGKDCFCSKNTLIDVPA